MVSIGRWEGGRWEVSMWEVGDGGGQVGDCALWLLAEGSAELDYTSCVEQWTAFFATTWAIGVDGSIRPSTATACLPPAAAAVCRLLQEPILSGVCLICHKICQPLPPFVLTCPSPTFPSSGPRNTVQDHLRRVLSLA